MVASLSSLFDEFWNSPHAYPAESLVRRAAARPRRARRVACAGAGRPDRATDAAPLEPGSLADELGAGRVAFRFAPARVVADRPAQIADNDRARPDGPVMRAHLELLGVGAVERPGRDAVLRPRAQRPGNAARRARRDVASRS